ncbi:MAG: hypothetical protein LBF22_02855 [Deltaproteobacteria bacterium]|jgi:hypothetical protein|nr:hypothetical protein [Deltaproteobacteria bacterium]
MAHEELHLLVILGEGEIGKKIVERESQRERCFFGKKTCKLKKTMIVTGSKALEFLKKNPLNTIV